jgi:hypothetical protein
MKGHTALSDAGAPFLTLRGAYPYGINRQLFGAPASLGLQ